MAPSLLCMSDFFFSPIMTISLNDLNQEVPIIDGMTISIQGKEFTHVTLNNDSVMAQVRPEDLCIIACAVYSHEQGVVYTYTGCQEHARLILFWMLDSTSNQTELNSDPIYGFITRSGHFVNRHRAQKYMQTYHANKLRGPAYEACADTGLISGQVDWTKVEKVAEVV